MFDVLLESSSRPVRKTGRGLTSLGLHAVVLGAALVATRPEAHTLPAPPTSTISVYVPDPLPPVDAQPSTGVPAPPRAPALPMETVMPTLAPTDLPTALPSALDLVRGSHVGPARPQLDSGMTNSGEIRTADVVDDPVLPLEQPAPRYPAVLAQAGITGSVDLSYVVDTLGRVEPGSIEAITSTHPAFDAAARAAVLASRFKPASLRGRPVRQLVRQRLSFRLEGLR